MALRLGDLAINDLMLGTARVQKVFLGTYQVWVNEIVVVLGARSAHTYLKSLFPADVWASPRRKRVVIPEGIEVGTASAFAIAVSEAAEVQADSWGGDLILDIHGTVSGIGGAANSGAGGDVIRVNLPGREGQALIINLYDTGTLRAGGGGGGKAGNGGAGSWVERQPATGWNKQTTNPATYKRTVRMRYGDRKKEDRYTYNLFWAAANLSTANVANGFTSGGWAYYWPADSLTTSTRTINNGDDDSDYEDTSIWGVYRQRTVASAGGIAGNAGRGQGFDGPAVNGAAAVGGGTGAGASGKSGNGSPWGTSGQAGANGANGNVGNGTAGAPGGLPGFYLNGAANCNFNNFGTVLGRVA